MTPTEVTNILRKFNAWRRGEVDDMSMPDSREVGRAIDAAIEMIERMGRIEIALREIAWSNDSAWQADRARSVMGE